MLCNFFPQKHVFGGLFYSEQLNVPEFGCLCVLTKYTHIWEVKDMLVKQTWKKQTESPGGAKTWEDMGC